MELRKLAEMMQDRFSLTVSPHVDLAGTISTIACPQTTLADLSSFLFNEQGWAFAGLIVEEAASWQLHYLFYRAGGMIDVLVTGPIAQTTFPSISSHVHAADWHERAAEDLFGLSFSGHPRLGEFVLHEQWPEGTNPMRSGFDPHASLPQEPHPRWEPVRVLHAPGSFSMPVGPIYSGAAESLHFQLETVGEEVVRVIPRLFYKYRAVEAIARGLTVNEVLLMAERFSGTTSFSHALAFCRAVEKITDVEIPSRAQRLRVFIAELERLRHHVAVIHGICSATGLAVAASQAAILEEDMLRLSAVFAGHRYLFGLAFPGGLRRDFPDADCHAAAKAAATIVHKLNQLEQMLARSSSFLDRLEQIGVVTASDVVRYGLVGPIARAAGITRDIRTVLPDSGYADLSVQVAKEEEGDGYARLRVLFSEARESARLLAALTEDLPTGVVQVPVKAHPGAAVGWTEAPTGAAFHWVHLDEKGAVTEWRIIPPSFVNWHGFHLAAEGFAFQDFPIILATFGLSAAESDR